MLLGSRNLVICIYLGSIVIASNAFSQEYIPFGVDFENTQKPLPVKVVIVTMFEIGEDVEIGRENFNCGKSGKD